MTNKWNDKSWQKAFLKINSHSSSDPKLLMGGVKGLKGLKDDWRLGALNQEYKDLRRYKRKINETITS